MCEALWLGALLGVCLTEAVWTMRRAATSADAVDEWLRL